MFKLSKIITAIMAITLFSSIVAKSNNSFEKVNAADSEQHLFLRVDDINQLQAGDKVIISNFYGGVLDHFEGNPIYLVDRAYDGASEMGDKYLLTNSLSKYQVLNVEKVNNYFTFQFTYTHSRYWKRVICAGKYLCYRKNDGSWDDGKVELLGDLYFTDDKNSANAQWKFEQNPNGPGVFSMQKSDEGSGGSFVSFVTGTTRNRFWYGAHNHDYGVRLYKYINLNDYQCRFNTFNINEPNRTTFYQGEEVDLTGLEFNLYLYKKDYEIDENTNPASDALYTIHSRYEKEKYLYSSISVEGSGINASAVFTYINQPYRALINTIEEPVEVDQYHLMNYSTLDYRGTYYIGYHFDEDGQEDAIILNGKNRKLGDSFTLPIDIDTNIIEVPTSGSSSDDVALSRFEVRQVIVNEKSNTFLYNPHSDKYVSYDNDQLCYVEKDALSDKEIFSVIETKPVLNGNMYFVLEGAGFKVSTNTDNAVSMFKLMPKTAFYTELDDFKTIFFEKIQCVQVGQTNFTGEDWLSTKTAFESLSVDAQGYLANLTYTHNYEEPGSIGDMIDRYDYILSKYEDKYVDYMNRKAAAYSNNYHNNLSALTSQFDEQNYDIIIVLVSASLLLTASALLIIKKKKKR